MCALITGENELITAFSMRRGWWASDQGRGAAPGKRQHVFGAK
jgi:hypothetical protein